MSDLSGPHAEPSLVDVLVEAALRSGWAVQPIDDTPEGEHHVVLRNEAAGIDHPVLLGIHDDASVIVCSSILPARVGRSALEAVMESLTRANSGLLEGKFELDLDDGEVRFTTSAFVIPGLAVEQVEVMFGHLLAFNLVAFDAYRPAIVAVQSNDTDVSGVIAGVEGALAEPS